MNVKFSTIFLLFIYCTLGLCADKQRALDLKQRNRALAKRQIQMYLEQEAEKAAEKKSAAASDQKRTSAPKKNKERGISKAFEMGLSFSARPGGGYSPNSKEKRSKDRDLERALAESMKHSQVETAEEREMKLIMAQSLETAALDDERRKELEKESLQAALKETQELVTAAESQCEQSLPGDHVAEIGDKAIIYQDTRGDGSCFFHGAFSDSYIPHPRHPEFLQNYSSNFGYMRKFYGEVIHTLLRATLEPGFQAFQSDVLNRAFNFESVLHPGIAQIAGDHKGKFALGRSATSLDLPELNGNETVLNIQNYAHLVSSHDMDKHPHQMSATDIQLFSLATGWTVTTYNRLQGEMVHHANAEAQREIIDILRKYNGDSWFDERVKALPQIFNVQDKKTHLHHSSGHWSKVVSILGPQ